MAPSPVRPADLVVAAPVIGLVDRRIECNWNGDIAAVDLKGQGSARNDDGRLALRRRCRTGRSLLLRRVRQPHLAEAPLRQISLRLEFALLDQEPDAVSDGIAAGIDLAAFARLEHVGNDPRNL